MKKTANIFCILLTAVALSACSYFNMDEEPVVTAEQPETVDLTNGPLSRTTLAPVEYKDVADVIKNSTDGSVQIYPLDDGEFWDDSNMNPNGSSPGLSSVSTDGSIEIQSVSAVPLYHEGTLSPRYPGVEIYPLDDAMGKLVEPTTYTIPMPPGNDSRASIPLSEQETGKSDSVSFNMPNGGPVTVYFDHNSVALNQDDLMLILNLTRAYDGRNISVAGHASVQSSIQDPIKRKIANLKVSMDRALSVARALIEGGIPAERIETRAYGEVLPALAADKPVDVASRRVEIYGVSVQ